MSKSDLLKAVSDESGVSPSDVEGVLSAFFDKVISSASEGDKVGWPGFGNFSTSQRSARTGRNPQTGEPVDIKASTAMKFTPSSTLKQELNKSAKPAAKSTKKASK